MNVMRQVLACSTALAVVAVPVAAQADSGDNSKPTPQRSLAAAATATAGGSGNASGPKLKKGKVFKKSAVRNSERYAGGRPLWVQGPVIQKHKGGYRLHAKASVRPHHRPGAHQKSLNDRLTLTIAKLKKGKAVVNAQGTTLLKTTSVKVTKNGVVGLNIPISKKTAKKLRTLHKERNKQLRVTLTHYKDTYPETAKVRDFQQAMVTTMTRKELSKKQQRKAHVRNVKMQKEGEQTKMSASPSKAKAKIANMNEIYYTALYIQNNSPFTQGVTLAPNIQCMNVPGYTPDTLTYTVPANTGGVQVFYAAPGATAPSQWFGTTDGNPSGSTEDYVQAVANAGRELLNNNDDLSSPEFYTEDGLIGAAIGSGVEFLVDLIVDLVNGGNTCGDYGQFWGVSSSALYVGIPGSEGSVYGTPQSWATGYFNTTGYGGTTTQIGSPANQPNSLPAEGSPAWNALTQILNNAQGQQSQTTFFNNGGMPAPVYANDGDTNDQGSATFSQGLLQWIYPNPGSCSGPDPDCSAGETAIQLGYLVDDYDGPVGPQLDNLPTVSATTTTDANTNQTVTQLECTIPTDGQFVNPFGGTQGSSSPVAAPDLDSLSQMPGVAAAEFSVTFYAQDAAGNYLYNSNTTSQSNFPGPLAGNVSYGASEYPPSLQASEAASQLVAMNEAQNSPILQLSETDLGSMINPSTGAVTAPAQFGCVVVPVVQWENMNVTSGSVWGANWPYPQVTAEGPLSSPYNAWFNWTFPVNALNISWTGDPYISSPVSAPAMP